MLEKVKDQFVWSLNELVAAVLASSSLMSWIHCVLSEEVTEEVEVV
jgi:hypothetical protein